MPRKAARMRFKRSLTGQSSSRSADPAKALLEAGWRESPSPSPWRWYDPHFPAAFYLLTDAFSLLSAKTSPR